MSSSSSQEGSRSFRRFRSPSSSHHSRSSGRRSHHSHTPSPSFHVSGGSSRSLPIFVSTLLSGFSGARLAQGYHQSSATITSSYVRHAAGASAHSIHVLFCLCVARSSSPDTAALPVDDACSPVRVAIPISHRRGPLRLLLVLRCSRLCSYLLPSPPAVDCVPKPIYRRSLSVGWLPATPSVRPERRESPSLVSVGRGGFTSPGPRG